MSHEVDGLLKAARGVVNAWEGGDLAGRVRRLGAEIDKIDREEVGVDPDFEDLYVIAKHVVGCWEGGDLAGAVRGLSSELRSIDHAAEQASPRAGGQGRPDAYLTALNLACRKLSAAFNLEDSALSNAGVAMTEEAQDLARAALDAMPDDAPVTKGVEACRLLVRGFDHPNGYMAGPAFENVSRASDLSDAYLHEAPEVPEILGSLDVSLGETVDGKLAYGFEYDGFQIHDPFTSECGRFEVSPESYGLSRAQALALVELNGRLSNSNAMPDSSAASDPSADRGHTPSR